MESRTVKIPNVGCNGCVTTIRNEIGELAGVVAVQGDVASKQITIQWNAPADWATIQARLTEIEYPPAEG